MTNQPRYASLRDYLALLRRQRWLILAFVGVFALAGFAVSKAQSKTYTAEADLSVRDISQDLQLIDPNSPPPASPAVFAQASAQTVARLEAARRVQHDLKSTHLSAAQLQDAVDTRVTALTSLVAIEAKWGDPDVAAKIANGFAKEAVVSARQKLSRQLDHAISALKDRVPKKPTATAFLTPAQAQAESQLQRLQTIKSLADPAEISERAQPPKSPSSPKVLRNTGLAAIVGLALGLLAAFMRDSLDRRIRGSRDAQQELGYPVLGRVGASALGSAGPAGGGRVPLTPADLEAFRVLRTNLAFFDAERPLRSILVTSGLPEEGKTTVAASLAAAAAAAGQRTLLVDGDLRRGAIASRFGIKDAPGLAEYLVGASTPQEILQTHTLKLGRNRTGGRGEGGAQTAQGTLVCIASGRPPAQPAELLASQRCQDFLEKVAKTYDLVVIDSSPLLASADPLELIPYVEGVIVCVRVSASTRDEARAIRGALGRLPKRPTGVVVTGLGADQEDYGYYGYEP
jgi:succinoglycan biosynthesis transport protein ExoP